MKSLVLFAWSAAAMSVVAQQPPQPQAAPVFPNAPGASTGKPAAGAALIPSSSALEFVGDSAKDIGVMPDEKRALLVKDGEANPFANRTNEVDMTARPEDTSEEQSIREVLQNIKVGGVSRGVGGLRVLVGNIILERGLVLPQLVPDQRERLVVSELSEDDVEIAWIDKETGEPSAKRIRLQVDVRPKVRQLLQGRPDGKRGDKQRFGVVDPLADRQAELGPAEAEAAPVAPVNQLGQ